MQIYMCNTVTGSTGLSTFNTKPVPSHLFRTTPVEMTAKRRLIPALTPTLHKHKNKTLLADWAEFYLLTEVLFFLAVFWSRFSRHMKNKRRSLILCFLQADTPQKLSIYGSQSGWKSFISLQMSVEWGSSVRLLPLPRCSLSGLTCPVSSALSCWSLRVAAWLVC